MTQSSVALVLGQLALLGWCCRSGACRGVSWSLYAKVAAVPLLGGVAVAVGLGLGILDAERDAAMGFVVWGLMATALGFVTAARRGDLKGREVMGGVLPVWELGALAVIGLPRTTDVLPGAFRALVVAPAIYLVCAAFGMSAGYLWHHGVFSRALRCEVMLARRFLLSKATPTLSVVTTIAIVGVTLGVWLVLVALGVLSGFEQDLQRKIIGSNAHLMVQSNFGRPFSMQASQQRGLCHSAGVVACAPFVQGEVAVASSSQYTGAIVFGIEPAAAAAVLAVLQDLHRGSLQPLADEAANAAAGRRGLPHIVIGKQMARSLDVKVGDTLRLISPTEEILTPVGAAPKSRAFVVAGIYVSNMYEYDARFAYVTSAAARAFLGLQQDEYSGLQMRCDSLAAVPATRRAVLAAGRDVGLADLSLLDWRQRNQTLFSALQLERVVAFVVLVFIILVASFSIVNTLTLSVLEKRREIAILKTMGATDATILKLFLLIGLTIGGFGVGLGTCGGVGTMLLLQRFGFWIPGDVYYIDSLPVNLNAADIGVVVLAATLIIWDFAVFPSWEGSRLAPTEGLRDG